MTPRSTSTAVTQASSSARASTKCNCANRQCISYVEAHYSINIWVFQCTFFYQFLCTTRNFFFSSLEQQFYITAHLVFHFVQQQCNTHQ